MKEPKVSIIMGVYNCSKYIKESIESILNQTYKDWEFIICDDGSTDSTYEIALEYSKKNPNKIILLKNDRNMGLNYTLNKCLKESKGIYIARQDGDDISEPIRLEKQVEFLENNNKYSIVGSNMKFFDENGVWGKTNVNEKPEIKNLIKSPSFCHATCIIKKNAIQSVNGYSVEKKLLRVEDYHLWFKLYSNGFIGFNLKEYLYLMRDDKDAMDRRTFKNRVNEFKVKIIGYRMLNVPIRYYIFALRPILVGILPKHIYKKLRKRKLSKNIINRN